MRQDHAMIQTLVYVLNDLAWNGEVTWMRSKYLVSGIEGADGFVEPSKIIAANRVVQF